MAAMKKAMKVKKSAKKSAKKSGKKGGMKKKAKRVSKVARGKRAKSSVFRGTKERTSGGLTKNSLVKNKQGRVVSKKQSEHGKKIFKKHGLQKWIDAVTKARKALGIKGFQAVGGSSAKGKILLAKSRSFYKK
uniref:Dinoflagellate viral nucleoprotein 5 n=1 Tax=Hematodinium sp. TaxID=173654 RepID=DVNP5_HEMSX|nr:RecName: Full=Dinoflagellate viral nucleoprotein 5; Short=DNVP5 [Hematodinium sp.]AFY23231.1 dinoflagellate viral nucleoprotein DVNP.5 [Hematodinium sp. SG-2012]